MREQPRLAATPVILTVREDSPHAVGNVPVVACLRKPLQPDQLLETVIANVRETGSIDFVVHSELV